MQHELIEFRGSYRYADLSALDRALADARDHLEDDAELEWLECFIRHGTRLWVHAQLPITADRFTAAEIVQTLARNAIEGLVEARRGTVALDFFPCGEDDAI